LTPRELAAELHVQAESLNGAIEARRNLISLLNPTGKSLSTLSVQIVQAQSQLTKLTTALAKEASNSLTTATEERNIRELEAQLGEAGIELSRLEAADALLHELITRSTGGGIGIKNSLR
jgi:septal ring factor EnvC (AmiA/AmiB activator)